MTKNEILVAAKSLEPHERLELMEELRHLVNEELTAEQIAEARRRADALDRGEVEAIPGDQVMLDLRERFRRRAIASRPTPALICSTPPISTTRRRPA